ncbi:ABC transporter permease subunit [Rhizobium sp. S95]|uniref:Oligopeptide transport system permease protein OppC n=1 Tax=Ciceribacter sichuanensis TaxID=2949647 RepID=A0AAJ1BZT3_9HYPH|nr:MULTISPECIES: ABC transporter permease subunit [unclassified Ciceribacter]MCM2397450.1 ABC transporter permease subunit [Ciceribacter sp. S95]MCO5959156.1 ABC transporter permease subunit [Ciceribacter sp. S101]
MNENTALTGESPAVVGRSLWGYARSRFARNRAAMASAVYLLLMAVVCVFGPMLLPNSYEAIYQNYTRVPPSLAPYPTADMIGPAIEEAVARARLTLDGWEEKDERVEIRLSSKGDIDPRVTRYIDRSDLLEDAQVKTSASGSMTISAALEKRYFFFGTDSTGRDLLARTLMAGRVSLSIGLLAGLIAVVIGVFYGSTAGFIGGRTDQVMMRIVDVLYSLPFIFFVIMLVVFFGRNFLLMFVAVGAVLWLDMARIVRGQTLSLRRQEFVEAAEALGVSRARILLRHIVPNLLGPVVIYMTLLVPQVIILESFLSYLGFGVQEPMSSWGVLIAQGARSMPSANWLLVFPSVFLITTLFALNFIGDGLRDALDPKDH